MVELSYPNLSASFYVRPTDNTGILIGPFEPNGNKPLLSTAVSEFDGTSFQQSKGLNGENNVTHVKIDGNIHYLPGFLYGRKSPTVEYPDRRIIPFDKDYWTGALLDTTFNYGYVAPGMSFLRNGVAKYCCAAFPTEYLPKGASFAYYNMQPYSSPPYGSLQKMTRVEYYYLRSSPTPGYWWFKTITSTKSFTGPNFPHVEPTLNAKRDWKYLNSLWEIHGSGATVTTKDAAFPIRQLQNAPASPDQLFALLATVVPDTSSKDFEIPEKDFGELAMEALESADRNSVNLWEFMHDLKDPTGLIPRLRNLNSLKGISDSYLSYKFGILPTVSDIKGIINAFKAVKPYLDRNGSTLLTAGYRQEKDVGRIHIESIQRIRIALAKEDNELIRLVNELESWGVIPTIEDLWDLVSYSFVIDWFVDVGGFLERLDAHIKILRRDIRSATMSQKYNISGFIPDPSEDFPMSGYLSWVYYHRWVSNQCPTPKLLLQPKTSFNHWLEGGALLTQRIK